MTDTPQPPAVALLIYPGFSEFQVTVALTLLARRYRVENVGLNDHLVRGEGGLRVFPNTTVKEARASDYAALLIPGGVDLTVLTLVPEAAPQLVADFVAQGKVVGAICGGPYLLGRAGVLEGRPYTATFTAAQREGLFVLPEDTFEYRDVVESGHVITAQGHAFTEFGLRLAERLGALDDPARARHYYTGRGNLGMEADLKR